MVAAAGTEAPRGLVDLTSALVQVEKQAPFYGKVSSPNLFQETEAPTYEKEPQVAGRNQTWEQVPEKSVSPVLLPEAHNEPATD